MSSMDTSKVRSVEVTRHAKERWVQRIEKQDLDSKMLANIVNRNETKITLDILECYENSQFLWQGALWQGGNHVNFSIYEDIIFVANISKTTIFTCYKVELPFPELLTKEVIKKSVNTIQFLRSRISKYNDRWIPWFKKKEEEKKGIKEKIQKLEQRYEDITKEIEARREFPNACAKEIEEYARIICNSLAFRQEWEKGLIK